MRVLILLLVAGSLGAQQPDCNLAAKRYDNPLSDSRGWTMRRYQWHAAYATAGVVVGETIHRTTKLKRWKAALVTTALISVLPHVRGVIRKQYRINPRDWAFDAFLRAAPLLLWDQKPRLLAGTTLVSTYFAFACFSSP